MRGLRRWRWLYAASLVLATSGAVVAASIDADSPQRVVTRARTLTASTWDTLVVTNWNTFSVTWDNPPTLIWSGLGIGDAPNSTSSTRDTLTSTILVALDAVGWDFAAYDVDTLMIGASTDGCTFVTTAGDW